MEIIKAYPILFILTVVLPLTGGMVGAYIGWDSLKSKFEDSKYKESVKDKMTTFDSSLDEIYSKESIIKLGNKAITYGDREAYLKLEDINCNFKKWREVAISEIARVKTHHYTMTSINGIKIEKFDDRKNPIPQDSIETGELIEILLLNSQFLYRAKSAELLSKRKENFIPEALLLSIFSDNNLEVMREATKAYEKITGYKSGNFFSPYGCLGFWYDNSERIQKQLSKKNSNNIIPFLEFEKKINRLADNTEFDEMLYWWRTSIELEQMLTTQGRIANPKNKQAVTRAH